VRVLEELGSLGVAVRAVSARADTAFARSADAADVMLVVGDPQSTRVLEVARVADARACGLVANSDLTNLHVALALEELAPHAAGADAFRRSGYARSAAEADQFAALAASEVFELALAWMLDGVLADAQA
jgi:voltage-gated potassium channel Kch